jgi:tetratricopeptide (TPR) repeat protein
VPELLKRVIHDHPDDELQAAMAWADLGRFYAEEGEHEQAVEAFRSCLDAEASLSGGGLHTGSELALAEVIVRAQWADRHPEALEADRPTRAARRASRRARRASRRVRYADAIAGLRSTCASCDCR